MIWVILSSHDTWSLNRENRANPVDLGFPEFSERPLRGISWAPLSPIASELTLCNRFVKLLELKNYPIFTGRMMIILGNWNCTLIFLAKHSDSSYLKPLHHRHLFGKGSVAGYCRKCRRIPPTVQDAAAARTYQTSSPETADTAFHPLVGGFNPSEKYEFVSWDDCSQYMEK